MKDPESVSAYPTIAGKIWNRTRDLSWRFADIGDRIAPGEFVEIYSHIRQYSMCSTARLRGLYHAVKHVAEHDIPGDVVECGVAYGGSAALLGLTLKKLGASRRLWALDTFEGLPPPSAADPDYDAAIHFSGAFPSDLSEVKGLFARLGILENTTFIKGRFQETLLKANIGKIAVLHLDGDWYDSVKVCLDHLYDRVTRGGVIQIDDYGHWAGARKAVNELLEERNIKTRLRYLDYSGRQLTKP